MKNPQLVRALCHREAEETRSHLDEGSGREGVTLNGLNAAAVLCLYVRRADPNSTSDLSSGEGDLVTIDDDVR